MRLPTNWRKQIPSALVRAISLAHFVVVRGYGQAIEGRSSQSKYQVEQHRLRQEVLLLREELRIKDARMGQIAPLRRPHYRPVERMAILELRAARSWSLEQTARAFLVTAATIATWQQRVDDDGPDALVKLPRPVNRFPDMVTYLVQRLKVLCPTMGKRKIAQTLARAGLHLGATTVARLLREKPAPTPAAPTTEPEKKRIVIANRPNHVWRVDLTVVPIGAGLWTALFPGALPQRWPFCWWIAVVVDHYSRRVMGTAVFLRQPNSEAVRAFLGRTMQRNDAVPKYLVCDRGVQFDNQGFRRWCRRCKIRLRYGALGQHGSIAVVERAIRTLKELLRLLPLVPMRREPFRRELDLVVDWYNEHRPHETLGGRTPEEVYHRRFPVHRRPRYEPRSLWPRGSPCAKPWALMRGQPGAELELDLQFHGSRRHLPIVQLRRVA